MSITQNYSIVPVLKRDKKSKKTGLIPIYIRLILDRKTSFRATNYKALEGQWNEDKAEVADIPNANLINAKLRQDCNDIEKEILGQHIKGNAVSRRILKVKLSAMPFSKFAKEIKKDTRATRKEIGRVEDFHKGDPYLSEINHEWLRKFQEHEQNRGMSPNTINTTFRFFRRIFRVAVEEGHLDKNPLTGFIFPKYVQPEAVYLTEAEVAQLLAALHKTFAPARDSGALHADLYATCVYFLIACHSGLRHSDWGKVKAFPIFNNNLVLRTQKTKTDIAIPVGNTLRALLECARPLAMPGSLEKCNQLLKLIGTMAGLKKELTTHVGRHTFATRCATLRIKREVAAEFLGVSLKTIGVYYHITGADREAESAKLRAV
jgi:site-specific recombinase XerD